MAKSTGRMGKNTKGYGSVIAEKGMATKYQLLKNKIMNFFLTL